MRVIHFGNIANVSYLLCYGLAKEYGIETILAVRVGSSSNLFTYDETNNPYDVTFSAFDSQRDYLRLASEALDADILHFHGKISPRQLALGLIHGSGVVRHFHGSDIRTRSIRKRRLLQAASNAVRERVLVSTPDLLGIWSGAEYLPNPVDPVFFEAYSPPEEYSIFLPTRIEDRTKGINLAFEAWDRIKRSDRDVILKVICWGEDLAYYRDKYAGDNRIRWMSTMTQQQMASEMAKSSLIWGQFKIPSWGLTELEAMALAKVVLMRDTAPKAGYRIPLISVNSSEDLAKRTLQVLSDRNTRNKTGQQARRWVEEHHSVKNVTRKLMKIYDGLL